MHLDEKTWLTSTQIAPMREVVSSIANPRKKLLFACACIRGIWPYITEQVCRESVIITERYIDGLATEAEVLAVEAGARRTWKLTPEGYAPPSANYVASLLPALCLDVGGYDRAFWIASLVRAIVQEIGETDRTIRSKKKRFQTANFRKEEMESFQCNLLRELFGNLYRAILIDSQCRTPIVLAVAQQIVQESRFSDLPILADALEDVGCTHPDILS